MMQRKTVRYGGLMENTIKEAYTKKMMGVTVYGAMDRDKNVEVVTSDDESFMMYGKWRNWREAIKDISRLRS